MKATKFDEKKTQSYQRHADMQTYTPVSLTSYGLTLHLRNGESWFGFGCVRDRYWVGILEMTEPNKIGLIGSVVRVGF